MTPGRGVGANTALRDTALLCRNLTAVRDRRMTLIEATRRRFRRHGRLAEVIETTVATDIYEVTREIGLSLCCRPSLSRTHFA
jgi:hypothetical protein